ncbi:hypothetical protein Tco_0068169, partial [Tanacetum coccineum]
HPIVTIPLRPDFEGCYILLYMFVDVPYPSSIKLMERMLKHKLELARDVVGNDLTTAKQLINFIKSQLVAAQVSAT